MPMRHDRASSSSMQNIYIFEPLDGLRQGIRMKIQATTVNTGVKYPVTEAVFDLKPAIMHFDCDVLPGPGEVQRQAEERRHSATTTR